jgi:putative hemolysin
VTYEVLIIVVLILANGLFAMSEIAIVSARRARLMRLANRRNRGAALALRLAENPGHFLSTVQVILDRDAGRAGATTPELAASLEPCHIGPYSETVASSRHHSFIAAGGRTVPKKIALTHSDASPAFGARCTLSRRF